MVIGFTNNLSAQKDSTKKFHHQIGISGGFGFSVTDEGSELFIIPSSGQNRSNETRTSSRTGYGQIGLHYHLVLQRIHFKSGVINESRGLGSSYLTIPLGIDVYVGKKINVILGSGFHFRRFIGDLEDQYESSIKERFMTDFYINYGIAIPVMEKVEFLVMYQSNVDITTIGKKLYHNPIGEPYYMDVYAADSFIKFALKYQL